MQEPQADHVQLIFVGGALLLSIATGWYLLYRASGGVVLAYTPRQPVPWGPVAGLLVLFGLMTAFISAWDKLYPPESASTAVEEQAASEEQVVSAEQQETPEAEGVVPEPAIQALNAAVIILIAVGFVVFIAVLYQATPSDLGLPTSVKQVLHDGFIGAVACVGALAPVHVTQVLLRFLLQMEQGKSGHELIKMLTEGEPSITLLVTATVLAVVVAPLCEELTFRLLFQGWLEKWEDDRLGWRVPPTPVQVADGDGSAVEATLPLAEQPAPPVDPPPRGLWDLPYGWAPILISAAVFGLAHIGYGPEPVPIFVLGLFLGYVYQRTHRIVPSIVCHALFNLFTVSQLWWLAFANK